MQSALRRERGRVNRLRARGGSRGGRHRAPFPRARAARFSAPDAARRRRANAVVGVAAPAAGGGGRGRIARGNRFRARRRDIRAGLSTAGNRGLRPGDRHRFLPSADFSNAAFGGGRGRRRHQNDRRLPRRRGGDFVFSAAFDRGRGRRAAFRRRRAASPMALGASPTADCGRITRFGLRSPTRCKRRRAIKTFTSPSPACRRRRPPPTRDKAAAKRCECSSPRKRPAMTKRRKRSRARYRDERRRIEIFRLAPAARPRRAFEAALGIDQADEKTLAAMEQAANEDAQIIRAESNDAAERDSFLRGFFAA